MSSRNNTPAGQDAMMPVSTPPSDAAEEWIALLGRRDEPTDGVEDYCTFLSRALARRGVTLEQVRVAWDKQGWPEALRRLRHDSAGWRHKRVILQFTALAWSRRGFPFGVLKVLAILRRAGVCRAVMFHEPFRQSDGRRVVDRVRGACQDYVIRRLYDHADNTIFADPLCDISWLPRRSAKATFIPIGANIPPSPDRPPSAQASDGVARTVCVFCFDDLPARDREADDVAYAVRSAAMKGVKLRLVLVGRGTAEAKGRIEETLGDVPAEKVEIAVLGIRPAEEVSLVLADSDAMLCVRGPLYIRRGSALAGIACGLPLIGFAGAAQGTPLEEAGLELVPKGDREALGVALTRVLTDETLRMELCDKSRRAHERFFSWTHIADQYIQALGTSGDREGPSSQREGSLG